MEYEAAGEGVYYFYVRLGAGIKYPPGKLSASVEV